MLDGFKLCFIFRQYICKGSYTKYIYEFLLPNYSTLLYLSLHTNALAHQKFRFALKLHKILITLGKLQEASLINSKVDQPPIKKMCNRTHVGIYVSIFYVTTGLAAAFVL